MRLSRQFQAYFFSFFFTKIFHAHKDTRKQTLTNKTKLSKHQTTKATIFCANFEESES